MIGRSSKTGQHLTDTVTGDQRADMYKRGPLLFRCRPFFCKVHERVGSDSEVVVLEQGSEGMRSPCGTVLNSDPSAESLLEQKTGAFARASRKPETSRVLLELEARVTALASWAPEMPRTVGLPRRRRSKERRPSMLHAGSKSRKIPKDA